MKSVLSFVFFIVCASAAGLLAAQDSPKNGENAALSQWSKKEVEFSCDGKKIAGVLYLPESETPVPAVILSHGFGGNYTGFEGGYCRAMADHGIAACAFDFCGGGRKSKSDGKTTEMSVLTEAADLDAVLDAVAKIPEIDAQNIFLLGESQGGFVSSYVAAKRPDDVRGLIAVYPAYVIQDDARKRAPDLDAAPETMEVMGMTLGKIYNVDALSFDIYELLPNFKRKVLILHGTADKLVPISYSERAVTTFPDASLVKFDGAGHGFWGPDLFRAITLALEFVKENAQTEF